MRSRRILITGLSSFWGGRLAQRLERDPEIETIIGVDSRDPQRELERTEFVKVGTRHALIRRIVHAARIDTVIDARMTVDSLAASPRVAHENNVVGTMNILTACGGDGSPVRKVVFKSSAHFYGCEQDDPAFFTEEMTRSRPARTPIERDIVEAEAAVAEFARRNRETTVTVLRFANGLGPDLQTSHSALFTLPLVPTILGFDPRYQFIHEDDIVGCLEFVVRRDLPGVYNGAADGVLALSEVLGLLGRPNLPLLSPVGTGLAVSALRRIGVRIAPEMRAQLRFGRALDNRQLKAAGYSFGFTTRETVQAMAEHLRLRPLLRSGSSAGYRYEREVEEFLHRSPSVRSERAEEISSWQDSIARVEVLRRALSELQSGAPEPGRERARTEYASLAPEELIALIDSLEPEDLRRLRDHERTTRSDPTVLAAIERNLQRAGVRD
jgi:UDP-glucose 4-epimerase